MNQSINPQNFFDANPLSPHAKVVEGVAHNGKPCRIVDNTGRVPDKEMLKLLNQLIEDGHFGLSGRSLSGDGHMMIGAPDFTHIQIEEGIYRFILFPYEARIEAF